MAQTSRQGRHTDVVDLSGARGRGGRPPARWTLTGLGVGYVGLNVLAATLALALAIVAGSAMLDLRRTAVVDQTDFGRLYHGVSEYSSRLVDLKQIENQMIAVDESSPQRARLWRSWIEGSADLSSRASELVNFDYPHAVPGEISELARLTDAHIRQGMSIAETDRSAQAGEDNTEPVYSGSYHDQIDEAVTDSRAAIIELDAAAIRLLDEQASSAIADIVMLGLITVVVLLGANVVFLRAHTRVQQRLAEIHMFDPLVGLLNREGFRRRCEQERARDHGGRQEAMIILDIDYFQIINETAGHENGDRLLARLGWVLREAVRAEDVLGRIGSNEFALLVYRNSRAEIQALTQALRAEIRELHFVAAGERCHITATAGVAMVVDSHTGFGDSFATCEAALLLAKSGARDAEVVLVAGQGDSEIRRNMQRANQLPEIIASNGLRLALQEIPSLSGSHKRCELLLRASDPDTGEFMSPAEIIGPAERFGLINEIDRWVFRKALELMVSGLLDDYEKVGINLSAVSIDDDFARFVVTHLRANPIQAKRVSFELTETAVIRDLETTRRFMYTVRDLGASFAIDDFGVGTASFGLLRSLPFETMKIDGQFVAGLEYDAADAEVIRSFVNVAGTLGITTVAERAETQLQVDRLRALNVDYVQGFAMHRPTMVDTLESVRENGTARPVEPVAGELLGSFGLLGVADHLTK